MHHSKIPSKLAQKSTIKINSLFKYNLSTPSGLLIYASFTYTSLKLISD